MAAGNPGDAGSAGNPGNPGKHGVGGRAGDPVWVVLQLKDGQVTRASWEAVAAARRLAGAPGAWAVLLGHELAAVAGQVASQAARRGVAGVYVADHAALRVYTPGATIAALAPALREARPRWVVFPHTYQTVDFMARLAQTAGAALLPEVTGLSTGAPEAPEAPETPEAPEIGAGLLWTRPILGGKMQAQVRVKGEGTTLVSVQSGAFQPEAAAPAADGTGAGGGEVPVLPLPGLRPEQIVPDREVLGYEEASGNKVDLTKADIIVAVGRGVGGAEKLGPVEELARALGAEIGASRPVIDNGWLPRDRQIGSSGQTVSPKLYVALGISGAIQHLVGMKGSTVIVAVNKDPSAPIFAIADYGVVGDLHEIVPALTAAVRQAQG